MPKRVVITGIGVITPIGSGKNIFWNNALNGISGIRKLSRFDTSKFPTSLGAEVVDFDPLEYIRKNDATAMDITSKLGVASSVMAVKDAGLNISEINRDRIGVIVGTTLGTISFILHQQRVLENSTYEHVHKCLGHMALHNCIPSDISVELGIRGCSEAVSSACISSVSALDIAVKKIKYENYDAMVVGGSESAFAPLPYAGLNIIKALTNDRIRPFDENADGTVLGEGAAMFIIEDLGHAIKRNANIYCEIGGVNVLCEGFNHFKREHHGEVAVKTIDGAIQYAGIKKEQVDFINAHGMGVGHFDLFESVVLKACFGKSLAEIPVTSIKPLIGHPLAAASALQIATTALAIKEGIAPHTLNTKNLFKNSNLNLIVEKPLRKNIKAALINSYAFGGKCAACVLKKYEE
ncbi:MAG: beta-ketoacyl-[acyl-carrier-protein] synthase family protein [Candidatus Omnitrophica bacterium]|nr:beta-ketoacyl-[acyl-carrier-protein] synthase family protein [Candidatus Omnitrophota bacterium]